MIRKLLVVGWIVFAVMAPAGFAQVKDFTPVTQQMLTNPSPNDWLMPSRTYDWQRFSPLNQITKQNVGQLRMSWSRGLPDAPNQELIPIVHGGVMYIYSGPATVQALDATNGDQIWEYRRKLPDDIKTGRLRAISIFEDMVYFGSPDGYIVALDARTGALRWETLTHDIKKNGAYTTGPLVIEGKVLSGRICRVVRDNCFISAHDAKTGKELWKFWTTAAPGEPGGDTWANFPLEKRTAAPWGLTGSYDPTRKLTFWGIGNPPGTRASRYEGNQDAISRSAPAELYSNSTVALDIETGKLNWYYQHTPGDDFASDDTHTRVLLRTAVNTDRNAVKWVNTKIPRGQQRDVVVSVGETGGLFVNDRTNGDFIWATPFPSDSPEFHLGKVDVETGKTSLNWDLVSKNKPGDKRIMCYQDGIGYFPPAYYPAKNSLYIPYEEMCAEQTITSQGTFTEKYVIRPGVDPNAFSGLAKVNMATGQIQRFYQQRIPSNTAVLATAGDLIFWGDMNRRYRAHDADTGKILWETALGGIVQNSNITYSVNGKQYVAIMTGDGVGHTNFRLSVITDIKPPRAHNAVYVFALP